MTYDRFIIIFTDTWRRDHLGFYGNKWIKTPAADRFAQESVVFEDAYAESLPTIQVRRAFFHREKNIPWRDFQHWLTSKDFRSWCYGWQPLAPDDVSFVELLKGHEYVTGIIGDTPFFSQPAANFHRAFDSYEWVLGKMAHGSRLPPLPSGKLQETNLANFKDRPFEEDQFASCVFRLAMKWLEENYWREKFYLHLDVWDPHEYWYPMKHYADMYDPGFQYKDEKELLRLINPPGGLTYAGSKTEGVLRASDYDERQIKHIRALYAGLVTQTDFWMGVFLDYARNLGVFDNTVIVFFSDHGTFLGERGIVRKPQHALYDELIRLPLAIRFPDKKYVGKRVKGFVYDHDLTATLLGLMGISKPPFMESVNFMPLVTGQTDKLHDYIVCGYNDFVCVRDPEWHYITADRRRIRYPAEMDRLYNVRLDPEMNPSIITQNPNVVKEMNRRIADLWKECGLEYHQP